MRKIRRWKLRAWSIRKDGGLSSAIPEQDGDRIMVLETCGSDALNVPAFEHEHQSRDAVAMQVDYVPRFVGDADGIPGEQRPQVQSCWLLVLRK